MMMSLYSLAMVNYLFIYLSYCMQPEGLWHSKQEEVIQTKGITQNKNYTIQMKFVMPLPKALLCLNK